MDFDMVRVLRTMVVLEGIAAERGFMAAVAHHVELPGWLREHPEVLAKMVSLRGEVG